MDQMSGFEIKSESSQEKIVSYFVVDEIIKASGAEIRYGDADSSYDPYKDCITLPAPDLFRDTSSRTAVEGYYGTLFHELIPLDGS